MEGLDQYLYDFLRSPALLSLVENEQNFNPPVTLTYSIERLVINHLKLWNLEDAVRNPDLTDVQVGALKRKIDYLNGEVRPRLVAALGEIIAQAIKRNDMNLIREPNLKDYQPRT